jgi:hypothetical protein
VIDAYGSNRHYLDHLRPIWDRLPNRGRFWTGDSQERDRDTPVLVACWRDAQTMRPSPIVYVEHGAGQTYQETGTWNGCYPGGEGLDHVVLFICPNETVADAWHRTYPGTPTAVVGCPKLDRWHQGAVTPRTELPTVAVTFHWQCGVVPETRSGYLHYSPALSALAADRRWNLLGHGHPRIWHRMERIWNRLSVESTPDLADVFDRADLLVMDNTSAGYEFASLGRPVVAVNIPAYRRDVHHGLRFWDYPPGLQCDTPGALVDTVAVALEDPPAAQEIRRRAVEAVYAHTDGQATDRAVSAIEELLHA